MFNVIKIVFGMITSPIEKALIPFKVLQMAREYSEYVVHQDGSPLSPEEAIELVLAHLTGVCDYLNSCPSDMN